MLEKEEKHRNTYQESTMSCEVQMHGFEAQIVFANYIPTLACHQSPPHPTLFVSTQIACSLVFESLVRSGYWVPSGSNQDQDCLVLAQKPEITGLDWYRPVRVS